MFLGFGVFRFDRNGQGRRHDGHRFGTLHRPAGRRQQIAVIGRRRCDRSPIDPRHQHGQLRPAGIGDVQKADDVAHVGIGQKIRRRTTAAADDDHRQEHHQMTQREQAAFRPASTHGTKRRIIG